MAKLKPCKYCGGKPELKRVGDFREWYTYRCNKCGCGLPVLHVTSTKWGAKRIWNKLRGKQDE